MMAIDEPLRPDPKIPRRADAMERDRVRVNQRRQHY
jgi:hypothetical protein